MAAFEQHCAEALQHFGKPFSEVHLWLDEFAGKPPYGTRHRKKRHHLAGIEDVRNLWGDEAAEAARQHIVTDLKLEGWRESDPFPRDEGHYQRMGLF
ncbi:MAG: hypothetical protein JNM65_15785 [Verrucomicrobiaceae bacterium]|nr:hypothetical protein [Verrucomicrobiaceae bacterium]